MASDVYDELRADLLFVGGAMAFRAADVYSESALSMTVRSGNPMEARDAFISSWIAIFGCPKCIGMDGWMG